MTNDIVDLTAQVEDLRKTLAGLQGELVAVTAQVRSRREVSAQVLQQVASWKAQVSGVLDVDLQRMLAGQSVPLLETRVINGVMDMGPWLLTAMSEPALTQWLASLTDQLPEGLDATQRAERMFDIGKEIELLEVAEESLLREADELGYPLDPRADARPHAAILLGFAE